MQSISLKPSRKWFGKSEVGIRALISYMKKEKLVRKPTRLDGKDVLFYLIEMLMDFWNGKKFAKIGIRIIDIESGNG
ncbi:MAG: hypothetical protein D6732_08795 [Methanobacteriota archaeon]|nr:MAG: hypothetical protein D6732_08795 [Euryarchaeota archaeon]